MNKIVIRLLFPENLKSAALLIKYGVSAFAQFIYVKFNYLRSLSC
jgi:hypothetical protein